MADELDDLPRPNPVFTGGWNILVPESATPAPPHKYYINQRVSINSVLGTVRYIGPVEGTGNEWLGIEWDDPSRGKHDGSHKGKRYFKCWSFSLFIISPGFLYQVRSKPISNRRFLHPYNSIERYRKVELPKCCLREICCSTWRGLSTSSLADRNLW